MINFSNNSRADVLIERSKLKYRNIIYVLSTFVKVFCLCRNISLFSNVGVLLIIGEFLYKCCKINSYTVSSVVIIIANFWIGTINGYFTVAALITALLIIVSLISMQDGSQGHRFISVFGRWFKIFYSVQLVIFIVLVNVVHKLLFWEFMLVFTGHVFCFWLYWEVSRSNTFSGSQPNNDASSKEYCVKCQKSIPYRGHHCSICNRCSTIAQYHNAWINTCINQCNRRAYLVLCVLAAATNIYQIHVSITSVCTPKMFVDWFLIIDDCRYIYSDFIYSWIFVSCVFNMVFTSLLIITILYEFVLISQNITHFEFENCLTLSSCFDRGFVENWLEFLFC